MNKQEAEKRIEEHRSVIFERGRKLYDTPELGFREVKTEQIIVDELERMGVEYQKDIAITGVIARVGSGKPNISIAADMDALPKSDGGRIHACGHSIQTNNALTVLECLLPYYRQPGHGTLTVIFTPAEELTNPEWRSELIRQGKTIGRSGKQDMIAKGYFDDVDCVLSCHASGTPGEIFDVDSVLTGFTVKRAVFHGQAAHSGAAPYLGRNALETAELAQMALNLVKNQFSPESGLRVNPVLKDIGGGLSIIPDQTTMETYIRANTLEDLKRASRRFDDVVNGACQAMETSADIVEEPGYLPLNQSKEINQVIYANMRKFAEDDKIGKHPLSGASGDIGDLSVLLPTVQYGFAGVGGRFHSDVFTIDDEELCYITTAKVMADTVLDLSNHPELIPAKENFAEKKADYLRDWLQVK